MKKKLLFVNPHLDAGGAEKSLVNLLNTIDANKYDVDLFLFLQEGLFLSQVPAFVNILPHSKKFKIFRKPLKQAMLHFVIRGQFSLAYKRFRCSQALRSTSNKSVAEQRSWKFLSAAIGELPDQYDVAIGFLEKSSIYFIVDNIQACRKIGFIHTYYSELHANMDFDRKYFANLNNIVTVSEECADDLQSNFPQSKEKVKIIYNIISSKLLKKLAAEKSAILPQNSIISIGRLVEIKGFDLAVEAAKILKEKGVDFHWYIIGEGKERKNLENLIEKYNLQDHFQLLGLKENPYPYIKSAKVFVQPSRYEGKSISVDEAKILSKPIILTNFTTAKDQIQNDYNGLICEMSANSLVQSIMKYFENQEFTEKVVGNLKGEEFGTESEIKKLYELIDA